jgi:hypothetical protein
MKHSLAVKVLVTVVLVSVLTPLASAQATRTWVSGVGDDANPCSRTAPCKTFAGAISKTAAGGVINVLDPGGFGALTITKSITISSDSILAGVLVSGTNGIVVAAGSSDVVILRGLSFDGIGSGLDGVFYQSGAMLVIENCSFEGFIQNNIEASLTTNGNLSVKNVSITGGSTGVRVGATGGTLAVSLKDLSVKFTAAGVVSTWGFTQMSNSIISQNTNWGVIAEAGTISVESSVLSNNTTAVQAQPGATVRLSNTDIVDNGTGIAAGGGTVASAGNNRNAGNGTAGSPNASVPVQ